MMRESAVDMMAAMEAVNVTTARNLLKPPSSQRFPRMEVMGLAVGSPSSAMIPMIPTKIEAKLVYHL